MISNIARLKQSTVAIGIREIGTISKIKVIHIVGSGFFITNNGIIMTAFHVLNGCNLLYASYMNSGISVDLVVLSYMRNNSKFQLTELPIKKIFSIKHQIRKNGYIGPNEIDIGIAILADAYRRSNNQFLKIKSSMSNILGNVCMCGYPSGEQTLDVNKKYGVLRFSPVTQFGEIVSFLPFDDVLEPYGLQTNILTGGGSSGSPIMDLSSGKVVGIAQEVLLNESNLRLYIEGTPLERSFISSAAYSKLGLVYGLSARLLYPLVSQIRKKGDFKNIK
jgi:hypothetical protein